MSLPFTISEARKKFDVKYLNRFRVHPGDKVRLKDIDPGFKDHHESHKEAAEEIERDRDKLRALQALLYADGHRSLLICLQGLDAGGKDGTISHILGAMNPQGCRVTGFKQPSTEDFEKELVDSNSNGRSASPTTRSESSGVTTWPPTRRLCPAAARRTRLGS